MSWILKHKNGVIKDYHVTYIREDDSSDSKTLKTQNTEQQFEDLMAGKTYEFQVDYIIRCCLYIRLRPNTGKVQKTR